MAVSPDSADVHLSCTFAFSGFGRPSSFTGIIDFTISAVSARLWRRIASIRFSVPRFVSPGQLMPTYYWNTQGFVDGIPAENCRCPAALTASAAELDQGQGERLAYQTIHSGVHYSMLVRLPWRQTSFLSPLYKLRAAWRGFNARSAGIPPRLHCLLSADRIDTGSRSPSSWHQAGIIFSISQLLAAHSAWRRHRTAAHEITDRPTSGFGPRTTVRFPIRGLGEMRFYSNTALPLMGFCMGVVHEAFCRTAAGIYHGRSGTMLHLCCACKSCRSPWCHMQVERCCGGKYSIMKVFSNWPIHRFLPVCHRKFLLLPASPATRQLTAFYVFDSAFLVFQPSLGPVIQRTRTTAKWLRFMRCWRNACPGSIIKIGRLST